LIIWDDRDAGKMEAVWGKDADKLHRFHFGLVVPSEFAGAFEA